MKEILDKMIAAESATPMPPVVVDTGACKEIKLTASKFEPTTLPTPLLHQSDGCKSIQSYDMPSSSRPTGVKKLVSGAGQGLQPQPSCKSHHLAAAHLADSLMWKKQVKDLPWALVFGVLPAAVMASSMPLPGGLFEAEDSGSLAGESLGVAKCDTNGL
ncbi:Ferulic acid decarboxylase 1 [Colletotrichum spinosum]|uniref:Ferulic acid decarboxylase 1 n=1 Tax=Colletotrichum spinosum TaxID=1347390 RepID=A0A4R8PYB6_9PEZI|nr:Ferulic acid decarboxylase 1 [Colletotrichum spinosum]